MVTVNFLFVNKKFLLLSFKSVIKI